MHTRDYSDTTQHIIDEEVERILREQEERAIKVLGEHKAGLDAVAASLLERETIDGTEVKDLVDKAAGYSVGESSVPRLNVNGNGEAPRHRRTHRRPATD